MAKPTVFTISAIWDDEASVWTGHCDDIPAVADAPSLDELLAKISSMALDVLPDNHPGIDLATLYFQITALRKAEPAARYVLSNEERAAIAEARQGGFVSDADVADFWKHHGIG